MGFEPTTCRVEAGRSVRLSYPDRWILPLQDGLEPSLPLSESGVLSIERPQQMTAEKWRPREDSNRRDEIRSLVSYPLDDEGIGPCCGNRWPDDRPLTHLPGLENRCLDRSAKHGEKTRINEMDPVPGFEPEHGIGHRPIGQRLRAVRAARSAASSAEPGVRTLAACSPAAERHRDGTAMRNRTPLTGFGNRGPATGPSL